MGAYTRLESVNTMLLGSGEHIVNSLDSESGVDTSIAEFILDQSTKQFLTRGVVNNRFVKKLTPSTNSDPAKYGKIFLPANILSAELGEPVLNVDNSEYVIAGIKQNPPRLWNITDQTDVWEQKEYSIDMIVYINWEDIDTAMQKSIISVAARDYQAYTNGDDKLDVFLAQREVVYTSKGRGQDIKKKRRNIFFNNIDASEIVDRSGPDSGLTIRRWRFR